MLIYPVGTSRAISHASHFLNVSGYPIIDHLSPEVSHVLMDVPGDFSQFPSLLSQLPENVTIISGNIPSTYQQISHLDLLQNEHYLWCNAAITAECAVKLSPDGLRNSSVLVVGYGRIGKHLCHLLHSLGTQVFLKTASHQAEAASFGLMPPAGDVDLVYNTAPNIHLPEDFQPKAVKIDLASQDGLLGDSVVHARGLPGKYAPVQSGRLIAETIQRSLQEGTL